MAKICPQCGRIFEGSNVYCCSECYYDSMRKKNRGKKFICRNCGKIFYSIKSDKNRNPKYCSKSCCAKDNADKKIIRVENTCKYCGKIFYTKPSGRKKYCSRACQYNGATLYDDRLHNKAKRCAKSRYERMTKKIDKLYIKALCIAQRYKCAYCGKSLNEGYHIEHLIPLSRGGDNDEWNIVLLCPHCNMSKNSKTLVEYALYIGDIGLLTSTENIFLRALNIRDILKNKNYGK